MSSRGALVLASLPPAHEVLGAEGLRALGAMVSRDALKRHLREVLDGMRAELLAATLDGDREALTREAIERTIVAVTRARKPLLQRVINATGVILHTNLGRAPLGAEVTEHLCLSARGYATVEYDLARGTRGHRDATIVPRLTALLGCEDAIVVNNNAAAVLLAATAMAAGREVIVSRGELVEIGGGFRIPEIIEACGAKLVEVGTTNRTHPRDYERAITERTAMILRVHKSNFVQSGFCREVSREALVALARARGVPVVDDLGSGALVDTARFGLAHESTVGESLAAGVDVAMFSGDKLLGGPQAGILVGRRVHIERLRAHPLMRAIRPGRLVLAALEATLRVYAEGRAEREIPVVRAMAWADDALASRARETARAVLAAGVPAGVRVEAERSEARVGGGALPEARLPSWAVKIRGANVDALERRLRSGVPAVVARVERDALVADLRTVGDDEVAGLVEAIAHALQPNEMRSELAGEAETGKISGTTVAGQSLWGDEAQDDNER